MSLLCCVRGCSNGNEEQRDPEANFFPFPSLRENQGPRVEALTRRRRMAWVSAVERPSITFEHVSPLSYVCSRHFHKGQPSYDTLDTDPDWTPSLHLGHPQPTITKKSNDIGVKSSKRPTLVARQRKATTASFLIQNECCVVNCGGRSHNDRGQRIRNGLAFFPFPIWKENDGVFMSDLSRRHREAWVNAVGRADITFDDVPDEARVCSRHFVSGKPAYEMKEKDPDWAPSLHLSNGEPQKTHIRSPPTARKRTVKKRSDQTVTHRAAEKPSSVPLKSVESRLQGLKRPMEMPPVDDTVQNFKDFFRNALKASLDACLDSSAQSPAESRHSFDLSWFLNPPLASVVKQPCASTVSEARCENCVLLQERITKLEERLAAPQFLQGHMGQWAQPGSESDWPPGEGPLPPEREQCPSKARFHREWLARHWFLRYSPKLNVMWCHVCRLYGRENKRSKSFVKGTRAFQTTAIAQHSRSSYHQECVKKFQSRKGRVVQ